MNLHGGATGVNLAVPAFFWFAGPAPLPLAFIGAAVLFLLNLIPG